MGFQGDRAGELDLPKIWRTPFTYKKLSRRLLGWLDATILPQQAIGTVWFWGANIYDQLRASGTGENTATWMSGGLGFLVLSALLQAKVVRHQPTVRNKCLLAIQITSAMGNAVAVSIFAYRRFAWTPADSACAVVIGTSLLAVLAWYWHRHSDKNRPTTLRYFFMAGWVMVLVAIELRSLPRLFQGVSLFANNPMGLSTVASGCYIAAVRLWAVWSVHRRSPSRMAAHAWWAELYGNAGSQIALTVSWIAATLVH